MKKTFGIIGFGRFGQLAAKHLKNHFKVFVSNRSDKSKEAKKIGVVLTSVEECAGKDIVLICVPISEFENILKRIIPFLKKGSLVLDACSVKEEPVKTMKKLVPKDCECISTHPLFGPDSAKDGLNGKKIVLCPVRTKHLKQVKDFLTSLGLIVIVTTPEDHDNQMAKSLALVHFIGKVLLNTGIKKTEISTPTHERLMELVDIVKNDTQQLAVDMQLHNRFTKKIRKKLIAEFIKFDGELDAKA